MLRSCIHRAGWRCDATRRIASLLLSGLLIGLAPSAATLAQAVQADHPAIGGPYAEPHHGRGAAFRYPRALDRGGAARRKRG